MKNNNFNCITILLIAVSLICCNCTYIYCSDYNIPGKYPDEIYYGNKEAYIKKYIMLPRNCSFFVSVECLNDDKEGKAYFDFKEECKKKNCNGGDLLISDLYTNKRNNRIKIIVENSTSQSDATNQSDVESKKKETILINDKDKFDNQQASNQYKIRTFKKFEPEELLYIVMYDDTKDYNTIERFGMIMDLEYIYDICSKPIELNFDKDGILLPLKTLDPLGSDYFDTLRKNAPLFEVDPTRILESDFTIFNEKEGATNTEHIATMDDFIKSFDLEVKEKDKKVQELNDMNKCESQDKKQDENDIKINKLETELHDMKNMMLEMMKMMKSAQSINTSTAIERQDLYIGSQKDSDLEQNFAHRDHRYNLNQGKTPVMQSVSSSKADIHSSTDFVTQTVK